MLRTESRVVEDTLQVSDLDSVGIRDKDTVREAFEKEFELSEDGKYFGPLTLEGERRPLQPNFVLFLRSRQSPATIVQVLTYVFSRDQP